MPGVSMRPIERNRSGFKPFTPEEVARTGEGQEHQK